MQLGLRTRLLGTVIGAIVLFFVIIMIAVRATLSSDLSGLAQRQLTAGSQAFTSEITSRTDGTRSVLTQAAAQQNLIAAVGRHDAPAVKEILQGLEQPNGLSWLTVIDKSGHVLARANGLDSGTVSNPLIDGALANRILSGITVLDEKAIADEYLTEDVAPFKNAVAIAAAVPVSQNGKVIASMYGGIALAGPSKVVDSVSRFTGGTAQVLFNGRVVATSLQNADGSPAVNVPVMGTQSIPGYFARIDALTDYRGRPTSAALWFGIPSAAMAAIQSHATNSILLYGLIALILAIAVAVFVVNRVSSDIIQSSELVSSSTKALDVLVVGTEVSNDHVDQTREKLETVQQMLEQLLPPTLNGEGAKLKNLAKEATGDIIVIDTLATELNDRMRGAVDRLAELNSVVDRLNRLVNGGKSE